MSCCIICIVLPSNVSYRKLQDNKGRPGYRLDLYTSQIKKLKKVLKARFNVNLMTNLPLLNNKILFTSKIMVWIFRVGG